MMHVAVGVLKWVIAAAGLMDTGDDPDERNKGRAQRS
jgi:hypothetical protein